MENIKKFCKKYQDQLIISLLLLALYIGECAIRPLAAPAEYQFIDQLRTLLPDFPWNRLWSRLPALLSTFAGAGAVMLLGRLWNFKHPERAAVFYLLFPPVFYLGTAATLMPLLSTGILLALYGLLKTSHSSSFRERFLAILSVLPVVIVTALYVDSAWCTVRDLWMPGITAAALVIIQWFNYLEQNKERAARYLDLFSRLMSIILIILACLVIVPALLRHFKVDFPPQFALFHRGELIIRPMLMLLLPIIWLNLSRGANKNGKKLLLIGGAAAFLLFTLPITLPWQIQKNLYWHYSFETLCRKLPASGVVCFAEKEYVPFFKEIFKYPVHAITENDPEKLRSAISGALDKNDVLLICSPVKTGKPAPVFSGKCYGAGNFRIFHYFKNGVEKK